MRPEILNYLSGPGGPPPLWRLQHVWNRLESRRPRSLAPLHPGQSGFGEGSGVVVARTLGIGVRGSCSEPAQKPIQYLGTCMANADI
jgi:hypothetical protein